MRRLAEEIILIGRLLFQEGLVDAVAGNISVRFKDRILITRRGSMKGSLGRADILRLKLEGDFLDFRASSELVVHRKLYRETRARAIVHAHPISAVSLSYTFESIKPVDSEGRDMLGSVRVLSLKKPSASEELARAVSEELRDRRLVIVRGHGVFSVGKSLREAYRYISCLEHSCRILKEYQEVKDGRGDCL